MSGPTWTPLELLMTCKFFPSTVFTLWKDFKSVERTWGEHGRSECQQVDPCSLASGVSQE